MKKKKLSAIEQYQNYKNLFMLLDNKKQIKDMKIPCSICGKNHTINESKKCLRKAEKITGTCTITEIPLSYPIKLIINAKYPIGIKLNSKITQKIKDDYLSKYLNFDHISITTILDAVYPNIFEMRCYMNYNKTMQKIKQITSNDINSIKALLLINPYLFYEEIKKEIKEDIKLYREEFCKLAEIMASDKTIEFLKNSNFMKEPDYTLWKTPIIRCPEEMKRTVEITINIESETAEELIPDYKEEINNLTTTVILWYHNNKKKLCRNYVVI
ncbi:MAG: hypothetical protein ACPLRZ_11630 [Thermovenabulum sp.]|uniref:hypothetical protein n=1 Tax=Thermovenabulum sp. TaxID=3100335 RepID=UPI003C7BD319